MGQPCRAARAQWLTKAKVSALGITPAIDGVNLDMILVINCGSSSLKFGLFGMDCEDCKLRGAIDWGGNTNLAELNIHGTTFSEMKSTVAVQTHSEAVSVAIRALSEILQQRGNSIFQIKAVGHRVVHGGTIFRESVRIDDRVRKAIADLSPLAPLHNPSALAAIDAAQAELPGITKVAVFDTAFFTSLSPKSFLYPLPYEWFSEWGVRRFGFHGISHSYCAQRAADLLGRPIRELRLVTCHLGNGCSASAIAGGQAVATTMGYTPIDGLMMGTRSGSLDPGILIHVQQRRGLSADALNEVLNHHSGLLGVSGVSADVRQLETAALAGHERANLALAMFADRVRASVGALAVNLGGIDALSFTGGVGENSVGLRTAICQGLDCLGLSLDHERNTSLKPDADIATQSSQSRILVIESQEDLMIAREVMGILNSE